MGYFQPLDVLEALQDYKTDHFSPAIPKHWNRPLDYAGAFGIATRVTTEAEQQFNNQGIQAITLDKLFLIQGLRQPITAPLILEPAVWSTGRIITPDVRNGHRCEPRVVYAFLPRKIGIQDIDDLLEGIDITTLL